MISLINHHHHHHHHHMFKKINWYPVIISELWLLNQLNLLFSGEPLLPQTISLASPFQWTFSCILGSGVLFLQLIEWTIIFQLKESNKPSVFYLTSWSRETNSKEVRMKNTPNFIFFTQEHMIRFKWIHGICMKPCHPPTIVLLSLSSSWDIQDGILMAGPLQTHHHPPSAFMIDSSPHQ